MTKNFRTLILKESSTFHEYLKNIDSNKKLKKAEPYTLLEFSKGKENSYDSKPISINDFKKYCKIKKSNYFIYKNFLELSDISKKLPKINGNQSINTRNDNKHMTESYNNNINDFLLSRKIKMNLDKKEDNNTNLFKKNKKNLLLNSIEINKSDYPKYIFLNKIFKIKQSKSKKEFFKYNFGQSNSKFKNKNYKLLNNEDYQNYINKRAKLTYNINFNSSFVHKIKTDYMINRLNKKYPIKLDNEIENQYSDEDDDLIEEKRDTVEENILNNNKIFSRIKNELFNQNKKYMLGNETKEFFKTKENKYNFLYDINLLPNFRNNLLRKDGYNFQKKLDEENYIDYKTWRYLNKAKIRIQKIKDDENFNECVIYEEDLNKENKDILNKTEDKLNKKYKEKYESFEVEDYLSQKKENQSVVKVINEKTKKFFYKTFLRLHNNK